MASHKPEVIASGIDELVKKLKDEGIDEGQQQALQLIDDAEKQAAEILRQAEVKAKHILDETERKIAIDQKASEEAVKVAFRDLVLDMKSRMLGRLSESFSRQVKEKLDDPALVEQLVREAASQILDKNQLPDADNAQILVPEKMLALQDIKRHPELASDDVLSKLVLSLRHDMLEQGIELKGHKGDGVHIRMTDQNIDVDISDKAIADLLLGYLQPRFLAMFDGVIR